jgi:DNA invertase Pin-like site-specific DNA recombinase
VAKSAFGYLRVSTIGQVEEGVSLDAQRAKIQAWCLANDVELTGMFVDAGISGKRADNRPELQAALDAVCKSGGVLVVYSLSRLARSTKDTIQISERLSKSGADLVSLSEKIDTTSAAGKMVFQMLAVLAEFERNQISERTCSAMSHKKSLGQRVGKIPFGHDLAEDGVALIENRREQAAIELIRLLRETGMSYGKVADVLNRKQIKTKEGAGQWESMTVMRILKRTAA